MLRVFHEFRRSLSLYTHNTRPSTQFGFGMIVGGEGGSIKSQLVVDVIIIIVDVVYSQLYICLNVVMVEASSTSTDLSFF